MIDPEVHQREGLKKWKHAMETIAKRVDPICKETIDKLLKNSKSVNLVIRANCQQCVGYQNVVEKIRFCRKSECSAWIVRPYQIGSRDIDDIIEDIKSKQIEN